MSEEEVEKGEAEAEGWRAELGGARKNREAAMRTPASLRQLARTVVKRRQAQTSGAAERWRVWLWW